MSDIDEATAKRLHRNATRKALRLANVEETRRKAREYEKARRARDPAYVEEKRRATRIAQAKMRSDPAKREYMKTRAKEKTRREYRAGQKAEGGPDAAVASRQRERAEP